MKKLLTILFITVVCSQLFGELIETKTMSDTLISQLRDAVNSDGVDG
mgnify:CR=1 FL=1